MSSTRQEPRLTVKEQTLLAWPDVPGHSGFQIDVTLDDQGNYRWSAWSFTEGGDHMRYSAISFKNISDAVVDALSTIRQWGPPKPQIRTHAEKIRDRIHHLEMELKLEHYLLERVQAEEADS